MATQVHRALPDGFGQALLRDAGTVARIAHDAMGLTGVERTNLHRVAQRLRCMVPEADRPR